MEGTDDPLWHGLRFAPSFPLFASVEFSWLVCPRQNETVDAVHEFKLMEIDEKANRNVQQFHVAEQLGFMNRQDFLDRLQFEQQAILDQNVKAQRLLEDESLVFDFDDALIDRCHLTKAQFAQEALFINAFNKAWPL